PLVVAVAEIGTATNRMKPETAAALVGAGMLSMLLFPALALTLRSKVPPCQETEQDSISSNQ
ncbi:MAG: cation:proton antiporter, partial [Planctomycetales bacterium]|nr:cation:proton antiporter [Planctomycetales bacterium]